MNSVYIARHHRAEAMADGERKMAVGYKVSQGHFSSRVGRNGLQANVASCK